MKKSTLGIIIGAVIVVGGGAAYLYYTNSSSNPSQTNTTNTTSQNQTPTVLPVKANPIQNTSTQAGLSVTNAQVENNTDPATGAAVNDRIQFTIQNSSSQPAQNLEVYYTMTDAKTKQSESYYQKLDGVTIEPGKSTTVFFDNGTGTGHYPDNKYSIYHTSQNAVDFSIEVSATGLKPATAQAQKGSGSGDTKD